MEGRKLPAEYQALVVSKICIEDIFIGGANSLKCEEITRRWWKDSTLIWDQYFGNQHTL
jgi:hypothetical protein